MHLPHPWRRLRRRFSFASSLAIVVGLIVVASAAAYYSLTYLGGTGSGTQPAASSGGTTGTAAAATATVTWPIALAPGGSSPLYIDWKNNDPNGAVTVSNVTATVTTGAPLCLPAWFSVALDGGLPGGKNPGSIGVGHGIAFASGAGAPTVIAGDIVDGVGGTISFTDSGTNQSACEGVPVTITFSGTATPN